MVLTVRMVLVEEQLQMAQLQVLEVLEVEQILLLQEEELAVVEDTLVILEEIRDQDLMAQVHTVVLDKEAKEVRALV